MPDSVESDNQRVEEFVNTMILAIRIARPFAYELGSFTWWEQLAGAFDEPVTTIDGVTFTVIDCDLLRVTFVEMLIESMWENDGTRSPIDVAEAAELIGFYNANSFAFVNDFTPNPITGRDLDLTIARWNRTLDYNAMGIFTAADVPEGLSTDFVDQAVTSGYQANAAAAIAAVPQYGYPTLEEAIGAAMLGWLQDLTESGQGVCTKLTIELEQTVTIERQAFEAKLVLDNETPNALESVKLSFEIVDADGNPAGDRFVVLGPTLETLSAVDGTGTLAANASGSAAFTLIPGDSAASDGPAIYKVKGALSYAVGGQTLSFPLFPAQITVLPNPSLELNYFIETQVFGDDPFTPELEPSVPFSLGLWAKNAGGGTAGNVTIQSAEPEIVENERDLLIDFDLLGTQVGTEAVSPSLAVELGDIGPGEVKVAQWIMSSTVQGEFVGYDVEISSLNGFNDPEFAIIDSATIEPLVRAVRASDPSDDGIPDFLVDQATDLNGLPDRVYLSEGAVEPLNAQILDPLVVSPLVATVDAGALAGWRYLRIHDPTGGGKRVSGVVRDDGRVIDVGVNAWQTAYVDRSTPQPVLRADIHVFDRGGSGQYVITFDPDSEAPHVTQWASVAGSGTHLAAIPFAASKPASEPRSGGLSMVVASFSEPIDPATFDPVSISIAAYGPNGNEVPVPPTTVGAALTIGDTSAEVTFSPALPSGLRYCIRIVGARDLAGNLLSEGTARLDVAVAVGDVTGDQRTNVTDFGAIVSLVGTTAVDRANPVEVRCDVDRDGDIDPGDLIKAMQANGIDLRAAFNPCSIAAPEPSSSTTTIVTIDDASALDGPPVAGAMSGEDGGGAAHAGGHASHLHRGGHETGLEAEDEGAWLGDLLRGVTRGNLAPGVLALRARPDGDEHALTPADAVEAFALDPLGEHDGWTVVVVSDGFEAPAAAASIAAMLTGAGLDVGVLERDADGLPLIVGPGLAVSFRPGIPEPWQKRVLDGLGGFEPRDLGHGAWTVHATSHFGGDAWNAMRSLRQRRDIELVAPIDADQRHTTGASTHEGATP